MAGGTGTVTSAYGVNRGDHDHGGIDQRAAIGTPIPFSGNNGVTATVTAGGDNANSSSGIWREVSYYDQNGEYIGSERFMHMSQANYNVGDDVKSGSAVGLTGDTGSPGQPHLHREVYDANENQVDPQSADGQQATQAAGSQLGPDDPAGSGVNVPAGAAAPGAPNSGAAGGAASAAVAAAGGAGCIGGGPSLANLPIVGGLLGNLGGVAQAALVNGAIAALSGGGIRGVMGAVLGSAAGALGSQLGASLGGIAGQIAGQALGGALGSIVAGQSPLQALTGAAFGALSTMGATFMPGLAGVMPAVIGQAALNGLSGGLGKVANGVPPGASAQFALAGGLSGTIQGYANNMTGNYTLGSIAGAVPSGVLSTATLPGYSSPSNQLNFLRFANNISMAAAMSSQNRIMVGSISEALSQGFGASNVGGYGARTRNMQDAMTFSLTTLCQNLNALSADMISLGGWDASNMMRLMQPGNVATQILMKGLGGYTGLNDALVSLNVPLAGLDNPVFDSVCQQALNSINDPEAISTVQSAFNMSTPMTNLGELTNLRTMMPLSASLLPVGNFRELGVQLAIIGIMGQHTVYEIGTAISKVETATDLNHIVQNPQPLPPDVANQLLQIYGYGGGTYGEQTMADFLGTAAGYVHSDTAPVITATAEYISNHPSAATLVTLTNLLNNVLNGVYTTLDEPGDSTASPPVPGIAGSITVPFPAGSQTFSSLDDAIYAFIPLIEAEHMAIMATNDPVLQDNIKKLEVAYNASCAQLVRESNNLLLHNVDLFSPLPPSPTSALAFTQALEGWALDTGYGRPAEYIERVATSDLYGDCVKYSMRQARNAQALRDLGINVEQYKLPQSQYYRDPEGFYTNMYTGKMPPVPANQTAYVFPRTPVDVYLSNRDKKLQEMGYSEMPLQNNQKDEIFYDSTWTDTDQSVLEDIGRQVVKTAIDRNIKISGNDLVIVNLDGSTVVFGEIKENGLVLSNNQRLIDIMMNIVNRLLYGDLKTTKYTNPFNTDQMIFGLVELLAQVTNQNVEALMKTITGGLIANGLLEQMLTKFKTARSLYDTSPDRNDPTAYGGVGPDAKPR